MKPSPHVRWRGVYAAAIGVLLLLSAASASGSGEVESGEVVLLITDHREAIDDFTLLVVTVEGARLHRRGARSDEGWLAIMVDPQEIDLTRYQDGATVELVREQCPWADTTPRRFWRPALAAWCRAAIGVGVPLELTPVRTDVRVRADRVTQVTFDLVVHDLRDHGKTWGVLLEEVRVEQLSAGS